jgi:integrase
MKSIPAKGHRRDTHLSMVKPYTVPVIKKDNPDKWFISYTYRVPIPLQKYKDIYPRTVKRFKVYQGINSVKGEEREKLAESIRKTLEDLLKSGVFNPFEKELGFLEKVVEVKQVRAAEMQVSEEENRLLKTSSEVLELFIQSRKERKVDPKTVSMYQYTVDWMLPVIGNMLIKQVKYVHISKALNKFALEKGLSANTINNQFAFANTAFIWLTDEDYLIKNPLSGKIKKLKTDKTIHKWYDRDTAILVKNALKDMLWLYRVCQFTYWIMIRSKKELQSIKIGDIDFDLLQVKFRKEWTKNDSDQNRDYPPEFAKILDEMNLKGKPKSWYIFGENGEPGPVKCGHNFFSRNWEKIRKNIGLSSDYTIYGWKHTRIVHLMMLKVSAYDIAHAARHGNAKTSEDYKRDYDISLTKVYKNEDLTF